MSEQAFNEWAILELMGHRRLAGLVKEQTIGSASFIRIDVFTDGEKAIATQFYNPSAVYCMTPVSEQLAREVAKNDRPAPVSYWELPRKRQALTAEDSEYGESEEDEPDDEQDGAPDPDPEDPTAER